MHLHRSGFTALPEVYELFTLQITALIDLDSDGFAESTCALLQGLENPNGIVWHNGSLYVQETPRLTRYDGIDFAVRNNCNVSAALKILSDVDCLQALRLQAHLLLATAG